MGVTFQIRSTQLNAWYAKALAASSQLGIMPVTVDNSVLAGCFGGKLLNLSASDRMLGYVGLANFPTTKAFTLLMRFAPNNTGVRSSLFAVGGADGACFGGLTTQLLANGDLSILFNNQDGNGFQVNEETSAIGVVAGQLMDLWVSWTGLSGANQVKVYAGAQGTTPSLIGSFSGMTMTRNRDLANIASITLGANEFQRNADILVNEVVIWDTVEDPTSYGARTGFIPTTVAAFEGYSQSDPGVANVRAGTAYVASGLSKTGTLDLASAGNLKHGVTQDNGVIVGTYRGADLNTPFVADQIKHGEASLQDGSIVTGTYRGDDLYDIIPEDKVVYGFEYIADGETKTGTRNIVTNVFSGARLQGAGSRQS